MRSEPRPFLARPSRRQLLKFGAASAAGLSVASLGARPAWSAGASDYRALVCVFLYGGADTLNLLVPLGEPAWSEYAAARGDLAEAQESLLPVDPLGMPPGAVGIHGSCGALRDLFVGGRLAFLANVGALVRPTSKAEFEAEAAPLPINLLSHVDQQREWQRAWCGTGTTRGWVGRMLDELGAVNGETPLPAGIAVTTTDLLMTGGSTSPYVIGSKGVKPLSGVANPEWRATFEALAAAEGHPIGAAYGQTQLESVEIFELLSGLLAGLPDPGASFPDTPLAEQLAMVAALIALREELGVSRQVFFVSRGGFDTHDLQTETLPALFAEVSDAIGAFQAAVDALGAGSQVVTSMHTEFGRSIGSNGKGSDHGWGGHAFVCGGPVLGGRLYGELPSLAPGSPDVLEAGFLLPRLGVDPYAATLARWFGLSPAQLATVFPNLQNFPAADLGFLG